MSSDSVLNAVQHYQRSIEKNPSDVARLLHCVGKLYKIPITVEHLQQTGVGRTVNALRKHDGEIGVAADAVVNKWKQLVAAESDIRAGNQSSDNEQDVDEEDDNNSEKANEQTNYNDAVKNQSNDDTPMKEISHSNTADRNQQEERSKDDTEHRKDTLKTHHKSSSSSEKDRDRHNHHKSEHRDKSRGHHSSKDSHKKDDREHKSHKSHSKNEEREKIENKKEKHSKDDHKGKSETTKIESSKKHSSSKDNVDHQSSHGKHKHHEKHHVSADEYKSKSNSNSEPKSQNCSTSKIKSSSPEPIADEPSTSKKISSTGKKRRQENEDEKEKGNSPKKPKSDLHHNEKQTKQNSDNNEIEVDDGIDSSMGANFADVLGMLNMPKKKAKKSLNALKTTSPKSSKKNIESDSPPKNSSSKINDTHTKKELPSSSNSTYTSQEKLEKKPELLTSKVKLPPLDPSIALELPIISNNYKPLPLNPTVMDCVFNSATSSSSRAPPPRLLSDAEALSHGISSKTMRTKVYSGVKTGQLLQAPSLFDLCIRVLQKNIDALEYTGGVPFDVLRPVLERASPQQLFTFEEYNPYLMEDSDVLWKQHVQRNYRGHKREEMESWREMFMRCQEDQERRLSMLAENIKQSQKAIALPIRKTQLAFVDSMVKPPRNVVRKQEQFGTKSKLVATPAARVAALCNVTPNAAKQGDARLRVAAAFAQEPTKISNSPIRPKKAPLMAKTLQFMRGRLKR